MAYTRTLLARQAGPTKLLVTTVDIDIEVIADEGASRVTAELRAETDRGPAVNMIAKLELVEHDWVALHVPAVAPVGYENFPGITIAGPVQFGSGNVMHNTFGPDGTVTGSSHGSVSLTIRVPTGCSLEAVSEHGTITALGLAQVRLTSRHGNLKATDLIQDSILETVNGDITAGGALGHRPRVRAETRNGNIKVINGNIQIMAEAPQGWVRHLS